GEGGLEPPHPFGHRHLKPARLPIPPLARVDQRAYPHHLRPLAGEGLPIHSSAVGMQGFERRLEKLVEGSVGKAFRSGLQPREVGRKVTRALDDERTVGVDGVPIAPNNIGIYLAHEDFDRFSAFADALARELAEVAREHARAEGYHFLGPVTV